MYLSSQQQYLLVTSRGPDPESLSGDGILRPVPRSSELESGPSGRGAGREVQVQRQSSDGLEFSLIRSAAQEAVPRTGAALALVQVQVGDSETVCPTEPPSHYDSGRKQVAIGARAGQSRAAVAWRGRLTAAPLDFEVPSGPGVRVG